MVNKISTSILHFLLLCILWIMVVLFIDPVGDFPLNDDWIYGKSVSYLLETGKTGFHEAQAVSLFAQTLWGALFCKLFGFSFTALRISTLVLGLIGVLGTYQLLKENTRNNALSFFGALLLIANPLFLSLSFTFMTDVPFYTFTILSLLFFLRSLRHDSVRQLALATLIALLATMVRQTGIIIPVAFMLVLVIVRKRTLKNIVLAMTPPALIAGIFFCWTAWLSASGRLPVSYSNTQLMLDNLEPGILFNNLFHRTGKLIFYCALFLLPVTLLLLPQLFALSRKVLVTAGLLTLVFMPAVIRTWAAFPGENIIRPHGIGPITFKEQFVQGMPSAFSEGGWIAIKVIAVLGAALLLLLFFSRVLSSRTGLQEGRVSDHAKITCLVFLIAYAAFLVVSVNTFDRYFIPVLPLLVMFILPAGAVCTGRAWIVPAATLTLLFSFSVAGTSNYLSWTRAKWAALSDLMNKGNISPSRIDGGYEFNGWTDKGGFDNEPSYWAAEKNEYIVSFGKVEGYSVISAHKFRQLLSEDGTIYILKKDP